MTESKEMTGAQVAELLNRAIPGANFMEHYSGYGCVWPFGLYEHAQDDDGTWIVTTDAFGVYSTWDRREGKLRIETYVPRWAQDHLYRHDTPLRPESISVNPTRPVNAIGKDIERRFLAPWREVHPKLGEMASSRRNAVVIRDEAMCEVAKSLGWSTPTNGPSDRLRGSNGIYDVYFGSDCRIGSFDVRADLTPEAFIEVVRLIQELRTDK